MIKFKNLPIGAKASIAYTLASFFTQGLGVISAPIFTRILSPADYGLTTTYYSWANIIGTIAMLSLASGAFNIGMHDYEKDRDRFIFSFFVLSIIATSIVAIIYLIFQDYFNKLIQLPPSLMLLMLISFFVNPAKNFWITRQRYEFKYIKPILITVISSILILIVSLYAVLHAESNLAIVRLWSTEGIGILISLYFLGYIGYKGKFKINKSYWKFALLVNTPLIINALSKTIMDSSDRIMIADMLGLEAAGKYGVVYIITTVATIVWSSINASLIPYSFSKFHNKDFKAVDSIVKPILLIYAIICILICFAAPEIIKILAPPVYYDAIYIIPPISAGIFFTSIYCLFGNIELYYKKTRFVMIATIVATLLNLGLNYLLIPRLGYISAAYTTLLSLLSLSVMHAIFASKIQEEKIHDLRFMIYLSIFVVIMCLSCNLLYGYDLIRFSIIVTMAVIIIIYRKKIVLTFRNLKNNHD